MIRQNETDAANDRRGPGAADGSPDGHSPTDGRWRYDTATPYARRLLRSLDETRTATRIDG